MELGKKFETIIEGMKYYTAEQIEIALKKAGFSQVICDHHPSKPWPVWSRENKEHTAYRPMVNIYTRLNEKSVSAKAECIWTRNCQACGLFITALGLVRLKILKIMT